MLNVALLICNCHISSVSRKLDVWSKACQTDQSLSGRLQTLAWGNLQQGADKSGNTGGV